MIRFLDAAGLPVAVYAVEIDGVCYTPEEIAAIVADRQLSHKARSLPICVCGHWRHLHDQVCRTCGRTAYKRSPRCTTQ